MNPDELQRRIESLGHWYHNVELAPGIWTNPVRGDYPMRRWRTIEPHVPADLTGKSVLDLSCNSGYYAVQMKLRGAARVVGVEARLRLIHQAELLCEVFGTDIELVHDNVYSYLWNLSEEFDYVFLLGLFYHLRAPLLVLDKAALIVRERLFFQTEFFPDPALEEELPEDVTRDMMLQPGYPKAYFVERKFNRDETNWWLPNPACIEAFLRSSGLTEFVRTEQEVYVCEAPRDRDAVPRYDERWT